MSLKCLPAMWETWVRSLGWEDPLGKEMATHSSIPAWRIPWTEEPGGLQSKRSLVGYSPRGRKESNTTKRLHWLTHKFDFLGGSEVKVSACNAGDLGPIPGSERCPGEGNGNPLQYSCLGNPMDRGAWWATVHGVAKSRTRLSYFTHSLTRS